MIRELAMKWLELPAGKLYSRIPGATAAICHFAAWADQQVAQQVVNLPPHQHAFHVDEDFPAFESCECGEIRRR